MCWQAGFQRVEMDHLYRILKKPLITERATRLKAEANQYIFRVSPEASKSDIKRAIEDLFKVKVLRVNTLNVRGKFRRMGAGRGAYRPDWKKAVVTLPSGQELKAMEEAS